MTERELFFEMREDIRAIRTDVHSIKLQIPHFVTWGKLAGAIVTVATMALAVINLL